MQSNAFGDVNGAYYPLKNVIKQNMKQVRFENTKRNK